MRKYACDIINGFGRWVADGGVKVIVDRWLRLGICTFRLNKKKQFSLLKILYTHLCELVEDVRECNLCYFNLC